MVDNLLLTHLCIHIWNGSHLESRGVLRSLRLGMIDLLSEEPALETDGNAEATHDETCKELPNGVSNIIIITNFFRDANLISKAIHKFIVSVFRLIFSIVILEISATFSAFTAFTSFLAFASFLRLQAAFSLALVVVVAWLVATKHADSSTFTAFLAFSHGSSHLFCSVFHIGKESDYLSFEINESFVPFDCITSQILSGRLLHFIVFLQFVHGHLFESVRSPFISFTSSTSFISSLSRNEVGVRRHA